MEVNNITGGELNIIKRYLTEVRLVHATKTKDDTRSEAGVVVTEINIVRNTAHCLFGVNGTREIIMIKLKKIQ